VTGRDVAVVVCTRDRASWLGACLDSLRAQSADPTRFEVVVVDNASRDDTAEVVRSAGVRLEREDVVGLSRARNRGLAVTDAPVVAFIDDDGRARPGWVAGLLDAFATSPSAAVAGGPIALRWGAGRPRWLTADLEPWYSGLDLGPVARPLDASETLYGANFAVRRDVALSVGGFDTRLGRAGRSLRSGEESDLIARMRAHGEIRYTPAAVVDHEVLPDRLSRRWLLRRTFAYGRHESDVPRAGRGAWVAALRRPSVTNAVPCAIALGVASRRLARDRGVEQ
jgi:glucosyl-dolichyl phosphate glucuronosyltransferase